MGALEFVKKGRSKASWNKNLPDAMPHDTLYVTIVAKSGVQKNHETSFLPFIGIEPLSLLMTIRLYIEL